MPGIMQTPAAMKPSFFFPTLFFILWSSASGFGPAADEDGIFRVVWVKGKPVYKAGMVVRDGQKVTGTEVVQFTGSGDVVVLMNNRFERIRLKPGDGIGLGKPFPVYVLIERESKSQQLASGPTRSLNGARTRGTDEQKYFQSLSDTLRLLVGQDLKLDENPDAESFQLLDQYLDERPGRVRIWGKEIRVASPGPGYFFLYQKLPGSPSRALAEIEFFDPAEVRAELRFVASASAQPDSARSNQIRFLRKLYPKVAEREVQMLVLK